ncbi:FAD-dependent oxidoreductase [Serratia sp. NA_112.1]|uniref:FAD-dependent oxidoreductase n=1 Tax=Serratia sp. NA_112.1 TaxID=3415665 RepID=UPI004046DACE
MMMNLLHEITETTGMTRRQVAIVGAGLAGPLLACLLRQRGFEVIVFEKRADPRTHPAPEGRSLNLAIAERGLQALRLAGIEQDVLSYAVPVSGRMVHVEESSSFHAYSSREDDVIWSVQRSQLNAHLLDVAEQKGVRFFFDIDLVGIDLQASRLTTQHGTTFTFDLIVGADGANSSVRGALTRVCDVDCECEILAHGYKELDISVEAARQALLTPRALHIWPRGGYMCMALPNHDGSFTATAFLPLKIQGQQLASFAALNHRDVVRQFFDSEFNALSRLLCDLEANYMARPVGMMATLHVSRWHYNQTVLIGDAAHQMVPFHGQGMNCAFEDAVFLAECLGTPSGDIGRALSRYETQRKPDVEAIQAMALDNYEEMRSRVSSPDYLLERELSSWLEKRFPQRFIPRYHMVTFTCLPYSIAHKRGNIQKDILKSAISGCQTFQHINLEAAEKNVLAKLSELSL